MLTVGLHLVRLTAPPPHPKMNLCSPSNVVFKTPYLSMKYLSFTLLFGLGFVFCCNAQNMEMLRQDIQSIIADKKALEGVAINGPGLLDTLSIHGHRHFPMQSVFKFHIGLAMLSQIDEGKFALDQKVHISKNELLPGLWSPIREKYPEGVTLTIAEILQYTISQSDNAGCDKLLKMLGGPAFVEDYIQGLGIKDISIKINEEVMQGHWDRQFENWTTPLATNDLLLLAFNNQNKILSRSSHDFLWKTMKETSTGQKRLKGMLPEGTVVAHKTGWSGTNEKTGITAAVNDVGIVFLPDGKPLIISVFITDSSENNETNEKIIADIAWLAWDYFGRDK